MTTLEFVKQEIRKSLDIFAKHYGTVVSELDYGNLEFIIFNDNTLEFIFDGYVIYGDGDEKESISQSFTCAYKTPKGYISKKKLPVVIKDDGDVTMEEATELLKFNTDAVKNGFDPFWRENEAKRRNASAWNSIAQNHISKEDTF